MRTRPIVALSILVNMLLVGVILVQCLGCHTLPPETPSYSVSDPAVVKLLMMDEHGDEGQCTAWKVGTDLAMTAGHCCDDATLNYRATGLHAVPGQSFTVLIDDDKHDVCVLRGEILGNIIPIALRDPIIGARIWTAGYPHGTFLISDGFWAGRDEDGNGVTSSTVWGGASGSPVMNADGQAIGVLVAAYHGFDSLTFISTVEWARVALVKAKQL